MRKSLAAALLVLLTAAGCSSSGSGSGSDGNPLIGTFELKPGTCRSGTPTGTYFRMIQVNGTIEKGPYFSNPDSTCPDKSFTVERPGTDGGLVTGTFQPNPPDAFDSNGNATARRIVEPDSFTAIKFAISTNSTDPQTQKRVDAPRIIDSGGKLSGQLSAWTAAWNNLYFNQGSPKPDGSSPGLTAPVSGTYDATTHKFVLTWASQIVGGPFNGFAGFWHLEGTFHPAAASSEATTS